MEKQKEYQIQKDTCRIAISGLSGCGNTTICKLLSKRLQIPYINYTFRSLATEKETSLEDIALQAEKDYKIDVFVDNKQRELVRQNLRCVVGSRLAVWFVEDTDLSIYLDVSDETRHRRIQEREKKPLDQVVKQTQERDLQDRTRYKRLYRIDILDFESVVDHVIDNNHEQRAHTIEMILDLLQKKNIIRVKPS